MRRGQVSPGEDVPSRAARTWGHGCHFGLLGGRAADPSDNDAVSHIKMREVAGAKMGGVHPHATCVDQAEVPSDRACDHDLGPPLPARLAKGAAPASSSISSSGQLVASSASAARRRAANPPSPNAGTPAPGTVTQAEAARAELLASSSGSPRTTNRCVPWSNDRR